MGGGFEITMKETIEGLLLIAKSIVTEYSMVDIAFLNDIPEFWKADKTMEAVVVSQSRKICQLRKYNLDKKILNIFLDEDATRELETFFQRTIQDLYEDANKFRLLKEMLGEATIENLVDDASRIGKRK
jgi:hypothetical protein